jgi:hypothetical protein
LFQGKSSRQGPCSPGAYVLEGNFRWFKEGNEVEQGWRMVELRLELLYIGDQGRPVWGGNVRAGS